METNRDPKGIEPVEKENMGQLSSIIGPTSKDATSFSFRSEQNEEESKLKWAAIERLPMFERLRTALYDQLENSGVENGEKRVVDVTKLNAIERRFLIQKLITHTTEDNLRLLRKVRERMDRVNVKLPTIEVRYSNLCVEAKCEVVKGKPLPTLWNSFLTLISGITKFTSINTSEAKIDILRDVNGIIKPSRITLLLGPPGCGKTTFLQALSGTLDKSLKVTGEISYNGYRLNEFVPQRTASYISQYDVHLSEMTVRETVDFAARFQGVGNRADILKEVLRREKQQGITPDPDLDAYMKAVSVEGQPKNLQTEYILKIMGLDICAETMIGDGMRRGISGGEKKRLTTAEMIVGPSKALFMDEISTGLDSSTTYQIVACLQQMAHITESTVVISLLQPAPETYDLFDDVILMAEGKIVYHGPRTHILNFFEECGFKCPERKGTADFLQEVLSQKDQEQYWSCQHEQYAYMTVDQLVEKFKSSQIGQNVSNGLYRPFDKSKSQEIALSFNKYSLSNWELFKACLSREILLMKRNSFVYIFKSIQLGLVAIIVGTVFLRTRLGIDERHASYYMGALFHAIIFTMVNGFPEVVMILTRIHVFYKQRNCNFYPSWAYAIPSTLLKIPISMVQSTTWTCITYFLIGYSPEAPRFFRQLLLLFFLHTMSLSMMRCVASYFQAMISSVIGGSLLIIILVLFGGFVLPKPSLPNWLEWGFWISPLSYTELGLTLNEFLSSRWKKMSHSNITLGREVLISRGLNYSSQMYWISIAAVIGFIILFNIGFISCLTFLNSKGTAKATISREQLQKKQCKLSDAGNKNTAIAPTKGTPLKITGNMVLPFIPLTLSFEDVNYYIDTPVEMREYDITAKRLQLLHNITGAFQPGVLSVIMGATGAGKTTLLDVLSGRKTGGYIEGEIQVGGYPKVQQTFARISGYCEQSDIHSPQITVEESLAFSANLRLSPEINSNTRDEFVNEVLETIELHSLKDALVGIPGVSGLSTEQRKRLTIAVELVSNPSIIFMDEPTSGLDARAAAIVMRSVKNVSVTGRTVICTIHQPSIDIFETFDEGIPGVPRIRDNYNPSTWIMEVTSHSVEAQLGIDFAYIYKDSHLYNENKSLVRRLSTPPPGSSDLSFPSRYTQNFQGQFWTCLWKQYLSYWRNPSYNLVRILFMIATACVFSLVYWKHGNKIKTQQDLFNMLGCIYAVGMFTGINTIQAVMPVVSMERVVMYRENFAGMYSPWAYSFAQVTIEIPYIFLQTVLFVVIAFPSIGFTLSMTKILWFSYVIFCSLLFYVYFGMMLAALTPTLIFAQVLASVYHSMSNLFSGYIIAPQHIPGWWIWLYYICPLGWTLNGFFTSQYGDLDQEIVVFGEKKSVSSFLEDYYGFYHDRLAWTAVILLILPILFASLFALLVSKLNFQRR